MILAHKIRLCPTPEQEEYFRKACGTARFTWNWALAEWDRQYKAGEKPTGQKLCKQFNAIKYKEFPWLKEVARDPHARPFINLNTAFRRFFKKLGRRPKFKKKGGRDSFYVANDLFWVRGKTVRLPRIGLVKTRQELRFDGKIMGATVSREADKWFISIQVDLGDYKKPRTGDGEVGVDLGIKAAATLSTGEQFFAPKPLAKSLKKLRRFQRSFSRMTKGSNRRNKQRTRIARLYAKIRNIRQDFLHKLTTKLCRENQAVVAEDLHVKGMVRNRRLARAISDIGFGEFLRQMEYKSPIYGAEFILADRFYPSSKTCSSCGKIKDDLKLCERTYRCECGLEIDRDLNAALNLRTLGARGTDASGHDGSVGASALATSVVETGNCVHG